MLHARVLPGELAIWAERLALLYLLGHVVPLGNEGGVSLDAVGTLDAKYANYQVNVGRKRLQAKKAEEPNTSETPWQLTQLTK